MNIKLFRYDFNDWIENDLFMFSAYDERRDIYGNIVSIVEGLEVFLIEEDYDLSGNLDNLTALGVVELNVANGFSSYVKWCCRVNDAGVLHESDRDDLPTYDRGLSKF